jgi:RNA polymerase sigma-32 factor
MQRNGERQASHRPLERYLTEVGRHRPLSREEEDELAREYAKARGPDAFEKLVKANLRFVVKVAYGYRSYGLPMEDLVQEGNLGLIRAIQKFDANRGVRLITYARWWIRAYIQNYILSRWSLVKMGTTQAQRRLFFSLARTRRYLARYGGAGENAEPETVASVLGVRAGEVRSMERRMGARDLSLNAPLDGEDGDTEHQDLLASTEEAPDDRLERTEIRSIAQAAVEQALEQLNERERFIARHRLMADEPMTLREVGTHFGFSRERARQVEAKARERLQVALASAHATITAEQEYLS